MEFCCPHCKGLLDVNVKASHEQVERDYPPRRPDRKEAMKAAFFKTNKVYQSELANRFPPTWNKYGGMNFADVLEVDQAYLLDCVKFESHIKGKLLNSIKTFLDQNNIAY